MTIASGGNVGIGTDNPATALEIGKLHTNPVIRLNDPSERRMSIRGPSASNVASVGFTNCSWSSSTTELVDIVTNGLPFPSLFITCKFKKDI